MSSLSQLQPADYARAADFLRDADPLHRALFAFHFDRGSAAPVLEALASFQNADGGFGCLEPDAGFIASSALATCIALHHLADIGTAVTHPLVSRALDYLAATFDATRGTWRIIPVHDNTAPHAPWWHQSDDLAANFGHFLDNPRPNILACLYRLRSPQTDALRKHVTTLVLERLATAGDSLEMHALVCYIHLERAPALPASLRDALTRHLPVWIDRAVERDPAQWQGYTLRPLDVAPASDSPWRSQLGALIDANLDFLIANQAADGSWHPHWTWGDFFPAAWLAAKQQWQAVLTLATLRTLRSYGRIAS